MCVFKAHTTQGCGAVGTQAQAEVSAKSSSHADHWEAAEASGDVPEGQSLVFTEGKTEAEVVQGSSKLTQLKESAPPLLKLAH